MLLTILPTVIRIQREALFRFIAIHIVRQQRNMKSNVGNNNKCETGTFMLDMETKEGKLSSSRMERHSTTATLGF